MSFAIIEYPSCLNELLTTPVPAIKAANTISLGVRVSPFISKVLEMDDFKKSISEYFEPI